MREMVEFRLSENHAASLLAPGQGVVVAGSVRKLVLDRTDPLVARIGERHRDLAATGKPFVYSWSIERRYTPKELAGAGLFQMLITAAFEPDGEACGTVYAEDRECAECGTGRVLDSELVLDFRAIPKQDVARSLAEEWVVSQRVADLIVAEGLTGLDLLAVRHKEVPSETGLNPESLPSGRALLSKARERGLSTSDWRFWVWPAGGRSSRSSSSAQVK